MRRITLLTDFGTRDGYVGAMKGVISSIAPDVFWVDLTHEVPPQDIRSGAYLLWSTLGFFSSDTVHLAVVDPGVGTKRRPIAAWTHWGYLVGPDNGLFSYVWAVAPPVSIVELTDPRYRLPVVSNTFHGRDWFAPAAAHLANGVPLEALGPPVTDPVRLPLPVLRSTGAALAGEVLYVDRFGNAVTSIGRLTPAGANWRLEPVFDPEFPVREIPGTARVRVSGRDVGPLQRTYGDVPPGEFLALVSSDGLLEVARSHGNAAAALELKVGSSVLWTWEGSR